ncbi:MAG: c-type cytochrome [Paracoccaceae bacterium]
MRKSAVLACLVALAATASADPATDPGHAMFTGQAGPAQLHVFPCHRCHGRDGRGGVEGAVPDIAALAVRYDPVSLRRALAGGTAADGRALSRLMPRYAVTKAETEALLGYLLDVPRRERRGVLPATVRFAVMTDRDPDYPALLRAAVLAQVPQGRLHGRTIEFVRFDNLTSAEAGALALVGPPSGVSVSQAAALGLPILFPRLWLTGAEDASLVRGLTATRQDVAAAIAADLRAQGLTGFAPSAGLDGNLLDDLRLELGPHTDPRVRVLTGLVAPAALPADTPAIAYLLPQAMAQAMAWQAAGWQVRLVLDAPGLVDKMRVQGMTPSEAHATMSATLLVGALRAAGRDLTRRNMMDAFARVDLSGLSLDYAAIPLTGTAEVAILPLD